jgi:hypothetical protein
MTSKKFYEIFQDFSDRTGEDEGKKYFKDIKLAQYRSSNETNTKKDNKNTRKQ